MNEKEKLEELKKCREDPAYFLQKYLKVTSIEKRHGLGKEIPWWIKQAVNQQLMSVKIRRKLEHKKRKRESRYSTAGSLLARERSLKKSFKRIEKKFSMVPSNAKLVIAPLKKSDLATFPISFQKAHIPSFDLIPGISGSVAQDAIMIGTLGTDHRKSLPENVRLQMPFGKNPIYLGEQI